MRFTFAKNCGGANRSVRSQFSFGRWWGVNDLRILCSLAHGAHSLVQGTAMAIDFDVSNVG